METIFSDPANSSNLGVKRLGRWFVWMGQAKSSQIYLVGFRGFQQVNEIGDILR
jgi:hypothetical protein